MFLNSKGRVITDSFLYPTPFHSPISLGAPSYLVEVNSSIITKLSMLLKMHKLTADISFDVKPLYSYYYYNDTLEFDEFVESLQETYFSTYTPRDALVNANRFVADEAVVDKQHGSSLVGFSIDNRIPNFGLKFVTDKPVNKSVFSKLFCDQFAVEEVPELEVVARRFVNGLYEANDSPPGFQLLPFDMNLDYINGLSLDKGCYVGQELTIRTYNSGVIRKRIVPVEFFDLSQIDQLEEELDELVFDEHSPVSSILSQIDHGDLEKLKVSPLKEEKPDPSESSSAGSSPFGNSKPVKSRRPNVGKILSVDKNLGFMLINLNDVDKKLFKVEVGETSLGIKVVKPNWWPED